MKKESFFDAVAKTTRLKKKDIGKVKRDVEKIDSKGGVIESKIIDLVIGLNCWGIKTDMSCQGHKKTSMPYPWVTVRWKYILAAARVLLEWNYRTGKDLFNSKTILWVMDPCATPQIRPFSNLPLKKLQEDAVKFGKFLQKLPKDHKWQE